MPVENIGRKSKQWMTEELIDTCQDVKDLFIVSFSNLGVVEQEELRNRLRHNKSTLMVVKNSICKRAFSSEKYQPLLSFVDGPIALIFGEGDSIRVAKLLVNFIDEYPSFEIKGGRLDAEIYSVKKIEELSKLPSKEILLSKIVGTLNSPIVKFVYVLDIQLRKIVYILSQIKKIKEEKK